MTRKFINKYDYHYYVVFTMFILFISGTYGVIFLNFSATRTVDIFALIASVALYLIIILYFFYLFKKQQWIIPRTWIKFQKNPALYCFMIFPFIFIFIFWMNFSKIMPMVYTKIYGIQTVEISEMKVKNHTSKGNKTYYFSGRYSSLPIFKISRDEFERYQNKKIVLQITSQKSNLGTIVHSIDHIRVAE